MTKFTEEVSDVIAMLEHENRLIRARNERLEKELATATTERDRFKEALERILAVSRVAIWNGQPQGVGQVGAKAQARECND